MKMGKFKSLLIIIVTAYFQIMYVSCNQSNDAYFESLCKKNKVFIVDTSRNSWTSPVDSNNKYLGLSLLSAPSDTFRLRIQYSKENKLKIFEYSVFDNKQSAFVYTFPTHPKSYQILFNKGTDTLEKYRVIFSQQEIDNRFVTKLRETNLLELPDCTDIPGYSIGESLEKMYLVEYSNKCVYKIFTYQNIENNIEKFDEVKKISSFIEYLNKEFSF